MKAGELLNWIDEYVQYKKILDNSRMPRDSARIRISCEFNKLKASYDLRSITPIHFNGECQILELSNHGDNQILLNDMRNKLMENSNADIAFIIYDDEDSRITGIGENDEFAISTNNITPGILNIKIKKK